MIRRPRQAWARHDHQSVAQEDASNQAFIGIGIDPDHQVIAFLDHVDGAVVGGHVETDLGISERERGGELAHRGLREQQRRTDPQPAARLVAAGGDRGDRLVELGQQRARALEQRPPLLGQLQRASAALDEPEIQARFQLADPAGQRRLGTTAGAGGTAEAAVAGDEVEIGERKQIHPFHQ